MNEKYVFISLTFVFSYLSLVFMIYSCDSNNDKSQVSGFVLSGDVPIEFTNVVLRSTKTENGIKILGSGRTDETGFFHINYHPPQDPDAVLYLTSGEVFVTNTSTSKITIPGVVRLTTVLGQRPVETDVVINERTTVATAYTMAQLYMGDQIDGPSPGHLQKCDRD